VAQHPMTRRWTRRKALGWIAAAPAAAAIAPGLLAQEETGFDTPAGPTKRPAVPKGAPDEIKCLVKAEDDLSRKERSKLAGNLEGLKDALEKLREFDLADDVEPALTFRALGSHSGDKP